MGEVTGGQEVMGVSNSFPQAAYQSQPSLPPASAPPAAYSCFSAIGSMPTPCLLQPQSGLIAAAAAAAPFVPQSQSQSCCGTTSATGRLQDDEDGEIRHKARGCKWGEVVGDKQQHQL